MRLGGKQNHHSTNASPNEYSHPFTSTHGKAYFATNGKPSAD